MARGGRALFTINTKDFEQQLDVVLNKVGRGTKKATIAACTEILEDSLKEVPRQTSTLAKSAFISIEGNYRIGFTGTVGYGGNGDPVNPVSGERASQYMIVVHEDLTARHPTGKAKFLEDPVRRYQARMGARASQFIKNEVGL